MAAGVYACVYIYIYIYSIYIYICIYIYVYIYICVCVCVYVYMFICLYIGHSSRTLTFPTLTLDQFCKMILEKNVCMQIVSYPRYTF